MIATRSRLMARLAGQGAMALLELDAEATEALIAGYPEVAVAVYASPRQTVIAGPPDQVDAVIAVVAGRGPAGPPHRGRRRLASPHRRSDPARAAGSAGRIWRRSPPTIPMFSTVDGADGDPGFDADYWVANLRHPVRFPRRSPPPAPATPRSSRSARTHC